MRSTFPRLVAVLIAGFIAVAAFGAGFLARGWWTAQSVQEISAPASPAPQTSPVPLAHELYQQVWTLLERDFLGPDPSETERLYASIRGLAASYDDPYTFFVEPQPRELERDQLRGQFGGIGAWIDQTDDGFLLRPMADQPAAAAGVQAGDRLLAVDGRPVDTDTPVDTVTALIRGPVGSEVCLDLARGQAPTADATPGSVEALTICIQRAEIQIPSVEWQLLESDSPGGPGIGYLKQSIFSERSVAEMEEAVAALQGLGADRFILDLRGNPGGLVDAAVGVAGLWLDAGPVLIEVRASGEEQEFSAPAGDISAGAPLVLIVDGASASASEIVAGALRDRGRAALVGEKTFGKGSVQLIHELLDESSLHVTTARWLTPDRHEIEGVGLLPEILVEPGADPLPIARDAVQEIVALGAAPAPAGE